MDRAAANGRAAVQPGSIPVDGQRRRIDAATAGWHDVHRLRLRRARGKVASGSRWGVGVSLRKSLERVYQRIDATLKNQRRRGFTADVYHFDVPALLPPPGGQGLERLLDRLIEHGIDATVADRLGEFLALGTAQEVARIRPLALADRWGLDPDQVVSTCLHGGSERDCSNCTGTCFARFAASHVR